jgi:Zn-dependent peptidase ImmA (M78 family)/transcriptional regulator with XRE-family HTH domain
MAEIPVRGGVLIWAREYRGLSLEEASDRLDMPIDELIAYESEASQPTLTKFEKLADTYKMPLSTLFRKTPPSVPKDLQDYRTLDGMPALEHVRSLQATLTVLRSEDENFLVPDLRLYKRTDDPFRAGEHERALIGVSIDQQLKWKPGDGFRPWRAIIERLGISVYLQKFDLKDCRGCCIWDEGSLPAIIINRAEDSENARAFTLIHEYAHLLVRLPGISDQKHSNPIEAYCNRFAAAFLMPQTALMRLLPRWPEGPYDWDAGTINNAARSLKVSAQALALRMEELGRAEEDFHRQFSFHRAKPRKSKGGGYVRTRLSEIGGRYTSSVMSALDRQVIDAVHASEALALGPTYLERARQYVERQRELARG